MDDHPDSETYPGLLVLRFDAGLFFASADALADRLIELNHQADPKLHTVVFDLEGVSFVDSQGADTLAELIKLANRRDIDMRLTQVKTDVKEVLHRDGVIDLLGESRNYGNVYEAADNRNPDTPVAPAGSV